MARTGVLLQSSRFLAAAPSTVVRSVRLRGVAGYCGSSGIAVTCSSPAARLPATDPPRGSGRARACRSSWCRRPRARRALERCGCRVPTRGDASRANAGSYGTMHVSGFPRPCGCGVTGQQGFTRRERHERRTIRCAGPPRQRKRIGRPVVSKHACIIVAHDASRVAQSSRHLPHTRHLTTAHPFAICSPIAA